MRNTLKIILTSTVATLLLAACTPQQPETPPQQQQQPSQQETPTTTTLTIMVPEDYEQYQQAMIDFVQSGGADPLETTTFVEKEVTVPYTEDVMQASAQAAAAEIPTSGGPEHASVAYFEVQNSTAYVLLDIDMDGWAGVSVSIATIHPLVEKTLLQFSEITNVVFDYTPEA